MQKLRPRLNYANVIATLALFLALGGGAYAATQLPKNSVGSKQLKKNSVTSAKVKDGSLTASDLQAGVIPTPSAAPAPVSTSEFATKGEITGHSYSKGESDSRYLKGTVVIVKTISGSLPKDEFVQGNVLCPPGYQAIGGGIDPDGIYEGKVSASGPLIDGQRPLNASDGQHGPANGWYGAVTTEGASTIEPILETKIQVICSPLG
jgi:hypothetical protein